MTQLQPSRIQLAEHMRNIHFVRPEPGTPVEVLMEPAYWAHVSAHLKPGDRIEVFPPERTYFAEFIVLDAQKLSAEVAVLRFEKLTKASENVKDLRDGEYLCTWKGDALQWAVQRGQDVLKHSMTKDKAIAYMRKMAGKEEPLKPAA